MWVVSFKFYVYVQPLGYNRPYIYVVVVLLLINVKR